MKKYFVGCVLLALMFIMAACADRAVGNEDRSENSNDDGSEQMQGRTEGDYHIEEVGFMRDGQSIYGKLYLPESESPLPVVIIAHGFGGNLTQVEGYAECFAENGIAAYAFDFIGGGSGSRSDGKITEMSVLTEAADMNVVMDGISAREDIDGERLFLLGGSQGGFVASYVAGTRQEDVKGLVALYPAYVLQDDAWNRTPDPENIPETMKLMGTTIGRIYNADAMSFDIYDVIKNYTRDVLIIHGTRDNIAPISYSERAVTVFPSAELVKIDGAGHGFYGKDETYSAELAVEFVKNHLDTVYAALETDSDNNNGNNNSIIEENTMEIHVTDGTNEVIFSLNDSSAAKSLYEQLPLTIEVADYSTNEKIFYPPEGLDTSDVVEGNGPFGTLAYFSPWGNVVMYYSECGEYPGLYLLGEAKEGAENIEKLSGTITVQGVDTVRESAH